MNDNPYVKTSCLCKRRHRVPLGAPVVCKCGCTLYAVPSSTPGSAAVFLQPKRIEVKL
jgi:hypothetical protein